MINRELIRIKAVQLIYAYYQNSNTSIDVAEREFFVSLSKAYDLYIYMLKLIIAVTKEARRQFEKEQIRAKKQGKEEPSQKFIYNKFAMQLEANIALRNISEAQKISWGEENEYIKKLFRQISESTIYKEYMANEEESYVEDRELWRKIYRTLIQDNPDLDDLLEEKCIYWNDDRDTVDTFVLKTIKRFEEKTSSRMQLLPEYDNEEDKDFARRLFRATIINAEEYQKLMSETSFNWDFSRLAYMDVVIMQIALAEMFTFPTIPIPVTINEYVELAKVYSTPKSGAYVNGILDAIARHLVQIEKLKKSMGDEEKIEKKS